MSEEKDPATSKGVQTVCDKLRFHLFSQGDILCAQHGHFIICNIEPMPHLSIQVPQLALTVIQLSYFLKDVLWHPTNIPEKPL